MADQAAEVDGRVRPQPAPGLFGMMAVLVTATAISFLRSFCPDYACGSAELSAGTGSAMAAPVPGGPNFRGRPNSYDRLLGDCWVAAVVVGEISSLAQLSQPTNIILKPKFVRFSGMNPGGGIFRWATETLRELGKELSRAETRAAAESTPSATGALEPQSAKPIPVQVVEPEPGPLQILQSIVGPLLQPMAAGGLVIVFVIMILLEREDLRDRLLRLAGRRDLHRTTQAMNDAAHRISRYLHSQLVAGCQSGSG
jgi:hypothetical protein